MIWGNLGVICLFGFNKTFFVLNNSGNDNFFSFQDKNEMFPCEDKYGFFSEFSNEYFYKSLSIRTPKSFIKVFKLL